jgi:hypothetical protein
MSFFQPITNWLDQVKTDSYALVDARIAKAKAAVEAKAASKTALDTIVSQLRILNANAITSQVFQFMIIVLLTLNFLALIGLVITMIPALSNERDQYVVPIVKAIISGLIKRVEYVKSCYTKTASIVSTIKTKATDLKTIILTETKVMKDWKTVTKFDGPVVQTLATNNTHAKSEAAAEALESGAEAAVQALFEAPHANPDPELEAENQDNIDEGGAAEYDLLDEDAHDSKNEGVHARLSQFVN